MNGKAMDAIRTALASDEFARAQRLWNEHAEQLRQAILEGSATEAMIAESRELIDWSRLVVKAFRAQAASRLTAIHLAEIYSSRTPVVSRGFRAIF